MLAAKKKKHGRHTRKVQRKNASSVAPGLMRREKIPKMCKDLDVHHEWTSRAVAAGKDNNIDTLGVRIGDDNTSHTTVATRVEQTRR